MSGKVLFYSSIKGLFLILFSAPERPLLDSTAQPKYITNGYEDTATRGTARYLCSCSLPSSLQYTDSDKFTALVCDEKAHVVIWYRTFHALWNKLL